MLPYAELIQFPGLCITQTLAMQFRTRTTLDSNDFYVKKMYTKYGRLCQTYIIKKIGMIV